MTKDAIVIERTFDAPVDLIWQMWTQAEHFKKWYSAFDILKELATESSLAGSGRSFTCCLDSG